MSEINKYNDQIKKLEALCEEHNLHFGIRKDTYPITLRLSPVQGAGVQLSMLEETEGENYISPDASLTLIFADNEVTSKIEGGTFRISDTLYTKFKNIFKKIVALWQQYFFRDVITRHSLRAGTMPVISETEPGADSAQAEEGDREDAEEPDTGEDPDEDLITTATLLVRVENKATVSMLQRHLKLGYSKAARLMDMLEERGVVSPYRGAEPREVLPADVPEEG